MKLSNKIISLRDNTGAANFHSPRRSSTRSRGALDRRGSGGGINEEFRHLGVTDGNASSGICFLSTHRTPCVTHKILFRAPGAHAYMPTRGDSYISLDCVQADKTNNGGFSGASDFLCGCIFGCGSFARRKAARGRCALRSELAPRSEHGLT